jgi:SAM-dependent methyltransferase
MSINLKKIENYYSERILQFGPNYLGADWNSEASQFLRFDQLIKIFEGCLEISLLDYGCGYGALCSHIFKLPVKMKYFGYDFSREMSNAALKLHPQRENICWLEEVNPASKFDYILSSGLFNVKLDHSNDDWQEYILQTLNKFNNQSIRGFSFNFLTSYSDPAFRKDYLYYADPSFYFDFCKNNFSKYVTLLHDYPLYEFTLLVKK